MGAQNFNFAPNFHKWGVIGPQFAFFRRKFFSTFSDNPKFKGQLPLLLRPPPCHDATV